MIAMIARNTMNPRAIMAPLFDLKRRTKRRRALSGAAAMMSASSAADGRSASSGMWSTAGCSIIGPLLRFVMDGPQHSSHTHLRVEVAVGQIDEQVAEQHQQRRHHDDALDDRQVTLLHRRDRQLADAGDAEHLLDDDRATEGERDL